MKLLLSAHALRTWGKRIEGVAFVTAEDALAADGPSDVDIAFMTREVTGKSSPSNPTPELQGFDAVVRKSPKLKWLQIHPAGAERPIYRELRGRGVKVTTASGATAVTVAHSTLGALIAPVLPHASREIGVALGLGENAFERIEGGFDVVRPHATPELQRLQSMFGQDDQLIPIVAAYVAGCDNTIGHDFDSSAVGSNHDRRLHQ